MRTSTFRIGAAAIAVLLATACSHDQTGTTSPISAGTATVSMLKAVKAPALAKEPKHEEGVLWAQVMPKGLTASASVGPAGGTLSIPRSGLTVDIPAGALSSTTTITVSVHDGKVVAYDFAPHGITFLKPLTLTQKLSYVKTAGLTANLINLGYYADPALVDDTGAMVSESNVGWVDMSTSSFMASIWHFSGYMVATGRSGLISGM